MNTASVSYKNILVIQTAFIGDAILATALLESLHAYNSAATIDIVVRKGNESLFTGHAFVQTVYVWDKKKDKYKNLFRLIREIRSKKYDVVINLQRFASTGFMTALSGAHITVGFDKNPFASFFSKKIKHLITPGLHEVDRNYELISWFADKHIRQPRLYPSVQHEHNVTKYNHVPFVCVAPNSVWFTKQYPEHKWIEFMNTLPIDLTVYLLGAPTDQESCERIKQSSTHIHTQVLAGQLNFLESAALMKHAVMNYVNDSAPMHIASAMNAPVAAVFCSTVPSFGFGPLSDQSYIIETNITLSCRPCGLHGRSACPEGHFKCAETIQASQLLHVLQ
ncbi:MAG: glycosyltransferase family 9 protein [Cytophagales bacterium]|nr:glycosyltransferase family 9 protein [Cytophaga sp.]